MPQPVRLEMEWWYQSIRRSMSIHLNTETHLLTTDASDIGWAAQLNDSDVVGSWTERQKSWHANQKEMFAVYAAVLQNRCQLQNAHVPLQTDNWTVVSYINKEGGTKSKRLLVQTRQLFTILDDQNIHLTAHYFPGRFNAEVDALSRKRECPEWHLKETATSKIFQMWGTPEIDLFASKTAHVVPIFASLDKNDQEAIHHNSFCHQWHYSLA
ncbi:uncharacterized protein LOC113508221 [Trichoplusia ni]|uniref:Uncharacterized protein LOC113508221 n=1 Tax=Trichoplusia ni TaxID=7111 RepID=A0A7E5X3L6_TRINI|nr:uncharacterized protein LOC113508221 [Trichoplusia ni]